MTSAFQEVPVPLFYNFFLRRGPDGQYTAGVVGLPEVRATGRTEDEALEEAKRILTEWLSDVRWIQMRVNVPGRVPTPVKPPGYIDPNDPLEKEYVEILARMRQEDLERTLKEYEEECSNSASTPTT
jgi:predicted RNase H-like HicB family nuclease